MQFTGYASITDSPYDMGWYTETIKRGAFKQTLAEHPDVQLLINHGGLPIARTKSGTMDLSEDHRGLRVDADLDPDDPDVRRLAPKLDRGDIDQMSFSFSATSQRWNDDFSQRAITGVSIHRGDVSIVNQGANPATSTSVRSAGQDARSRPGGRLGLAERRQRAKGLGCRLERRSTPLSGAWVGGLFVVDDLEDFEERLQRDIEAAHGLRLRIESLRYGPRVL